MNQRISKLEQDVKDLNKELDKQKVRAEDLLEELMQHKKRDLHTIDIAFVHASPKYVNDKFWPLLDFDTECKGVKKAIKDSNHQVKFK